MALRAGPVGLGYEAGLELVGLAEAFGSRSDRCRDLPVDCLSYAALLAGVRFVRHLTADLELVRTGGIRLSN